MSVDLDRIDSCRPLLGLDLASRESLARVGREVSFERGERVVSLLSRQTRFLILTEGLAKLVGVSADGIERILFVFRPCDIIGSRILLGDESESPYEIVAMDDIEAVSIGESDLVVLGREHPDILLVITRDFSRRLANLTDRMLTATSASVPVRLCRLLLDFANDSGPQQDEFVPLDHRLTHETMAQIIGASRPHTSTVLRDLEEAGAVHRRRGRGLLINAVKLRQIVAGGAVAV